MAKKKKQAKNKQANQAVNSSLQTLREKKKQLEAKGKDTSKIQAKINAAKANNANAPQQEVYSEDVDLNKQAQGLADALGATNRLGLTGDPAQQDLSELRALLDPTSGAYIGQRTAEDKNTLEAMERQVQVAGNRSQEMASLLGLFKDGLAGLNATENQAIREQAQREVNREYQTASYELQKAQARNRTRSGAASRQASDLARDRARTQSQMEQDLLIKNIDIQDQRRDQYGRILGEQEQNEFARTNQALRDFADASSGIQQREDNRLLTTRGQYLDASQFNIGEQNKTKSANLAAATGLLGLANTERNNQRQYRLAKQGLAQTGRSSGGSQGGDPNQALYAALEGLGRQRFGDEATV